MRRGALPPRSIQNFQSLTSLYNVVLGSDTMDERATAMVRVWQVVRAIPHGATASYGEVARRAGLPPEQGVRWSSAGRRPATTGR